MTEKCRLHRCNLHFLSLIVVCENHHKTTLCKLNKRFRKRKNFICRRRGFLRMLTRIMENQGFGAVHKTVHTVNNFAENCLSYGYCQLQFYSCFNFFRFFSASFPSRPAKWSRIFSRYILSVPFRAQPSSSESIFLSLYYPPK